MKDRKFFGLVILLVLFTFLITGCLLITQNRLTIQIEGEGFTEPTVGTYRFPEGAEIELIVTPESEWIFKGWKDEKGEIITKKERFNFIMPDKNKILTARFFIELDEDYEITNVFECENLKNVIRNITDISEGPIMRSDVHFIRELHAKGKGIKSLKGLEYFLNLQKLNLSHEDYDNWLGFGWEYNYIEDLSPISNLISLEMLVLNYNQIKDITPLSNLTNLKELIINHNYIENIEALENLNKLKRIELIANYIYNLNGLSGLNNLEYINFNYNELVSICSIENMSNLKDINLINNKISDISPLSKNENLNSHVQIDIRINNLDLSDNSYNMNDINLLIQRGVHMNYKYPIQYNEANSEQGFNFPYYTYYNKNVDKNKPIYIMVFPNNTGVSNNLKFHVRRSKPCPYILGLDKLNIMFLSPTFPRMKVDGLHLYTHSLDHHTLRSDNQKFKRIDLQLIEMVEDFRNKLEKDGYIVEDKFLMEGYSAGGMFTNRFAMIHPEKIKAFSAGHCGGWPMLPMKEYNSKNVMYPLGISGIEELIGKEFNMAEFKKVKGFIYGGSADDNFHIDFDYYDLAVEILGDKAYDIWPRVKLIYENKGLSNIEVKLYEGFDMDHGKTGPEAYEDVRSFFENVIKD